MKVHSYKVELGQTVAYLDIILASSQLWVYLGTKERRLDNLQMILQSPLQEKPLQREIQEDEPIAYDMRSISDSLGLSLARKTGMPVFFAFNATSLPQMELSELLKVVRPFVTEVVNA